MKKSEPNLNFVRRALRVYHFVIVNNGAIKVVDRLYHICYIHALEWISLLRRCIVQLFRG